MNFPLTIRDHNIMLKEAHKSLDHFTPKPLLYFSKNNAPIGIFDSGIGGLSILNVIRKILPNEHLIYYADNLYMPYGEKTNDFIKHRGTSIATWLVQKKSCKALVIACNTASAYIADRLRHLLSIPIIAIEPGIKPAVILSKKKRLAF